MFQESTVLVQSPASSANLGPGFDAFGLCLSLHDDIRAEVTASGLTVDIVGEGAEDLSRDETNLVVRAMRAGFSALGEQPPGLRVSCTNRIPQARGLGSSAAAIVGGILAARSLVANGESKLTQQAVLTLATELEGHPDNVAAALLGGFTLAWRDESSGLPRATVLADMPNITPVLYIPETPMSTAKARAAVPTEISHTNAAATVSRAALLVHALTAAPQYLLDATCDWLHQPYRAPCMPQSAELIAKLRAAGLPAVLSGAGPSVLIVHTNSTSNREIHELPDMPGFTKINVNVMPGSTASIEESTFPIGT